MKYVLTGETMEIGGRTLHRIKALRDIPRYGVKTGDLGGWIEKEENLSQDGSAWVGDFAQVYDDAWVYGDARVCGNARVYADARVFGDALVSGNAEVSGDARVYGDAQVYDFAQVYDDAWVYGDARVCGNARVYADAQVSGNAQVETSRHVFWASHVGSDPDGTLTAYTVRSGEIEVTRGCFRGTLDEFEEAVRGRHGGNRYAEEYLALIEFIRLRFCDVVNKNRSEEREYAH